MLHTATRSDHQLVGPDLAERGHHVHTLDVDGSGSEPRLGLFFATRRRLGEPDNRGPDKRSAVRCFDLDALPDELIPYPASGVDSYRTGVPFSVHGWTTQ